MTLDDIRTLRYGREAKFDLRLFNVLLADEPGLMRPQWWINEIVDLGGRRPVILKGDEAAPFIMAVWVKADVCLSVLYGEPIRQGVEAIERALGVDSGEAFRSYEVYRSNLHRRFPDLESVARGWLEEAANRLQSYRRYGPVAATTLAG